MGTEWYRRVFPATVIDADKNSETEFMTTERGYRFSTSVGGVLTGRDGGLIIADDLMKPADANSEAAAEVAALWNAIEKSVKAIHGIYEGVAMHRVAA